MHLLCFLGNPGKEYETTRHNAGWMCEEHWAKNMNAEQAHRESKFFGTLRKCNLWGESTVWVKPNTFMNGSGKALLAVSQFYKIPTENIILIYDDVDLLFGEIRFRKKGSSGGHNGVKDCIRVLGTDEIIRIKIGVKTERKTKFASTADFVLSDFSAEEQRALSEKIFPQALEILQKEVFSLRT